MSKKATNDNVEMALTHLESTGEEEGYVLSAASSPRKSTEEETTEKCKNESREKRLSSHYKRRLLRPKQTRKTQREEIE